MDVIVGVDMLLNLHVVAYVVPPQAEDSTNNSDYMYTMRVGAKF